MFCCTQELESDFKIIKTFTFTTDKEDYSLQFNDEVLHFLAYTSIKNVPATNYPCSDICAGKIGVIQFRSDVDAAAAMRFTGKVDPYEEDLDKTKVLVAQIEQCKDRCYWGHLQDYERPTIKLHVEN